MENQGQGKDKNNKDEGNFTSPYQLKSITQWWQQYSPLAWSQMFNEYIKYTSSMREIYKEYIKSSERMTELYKESVKSTERMTKFWSNKFGTLPSFKKQRKEKDK